MRRELAVFGSLDTSRRSTLAGVARTVMREVLVTRAHRDFWLSGRVMLAERKAAVT